MRIRKEFIDTHSRSWWNGNEKIQLGEGAWEIFIKRKQQEERDGLIKLVELRELRSYPSSGEKRIEAA